MKVEPGMVGAAKSPRLRQGASLAAAAVALVAMGAAYQATAPVATAAAPQLPAPPPNGEMGFVVTQFHPAFHNGGDKTDCPVMMGTLKDSYLRTLPPARRAALSKPENTNELDRLWKAYGLGPNNANLCSNVYEFLDRPATPEMKGKVAWGLNLDNDTGDGSSDPYTCKHENFTSPTGERGIDYQLWRAQGCSATLRGANNDGKSDMRFAYDGAMMSGEMTQVILLRGVNSLANDEDVEVIYANTDDRPIADSNGKPITNASFTVSLQGRKVEYRNVLKGRIIDGVLETASKDILLNANGGPFDLARSKVRIQFQADGTIMGLVGGYQPIANILRLPRGGGRGSVQVAGIDCAGQYITLRKLADGDRDPATGQCRKISYAYELVGVPAFVNDAVPRQNVATK